MPDEFLKILLDELRLRGLSRQTLKSYSRIVSTYLKRYPLKYSDTDSIRSYLLHLHDRGLASSSINQVLNALKFFFRFVLKREFGVQLPYAKRPGKLPEVLTQLEVLSVLDVCKNPKHKLLLSLAYGCGLRVSEVIALRVSDVDIEQLTLRVRSGKGNRDRVTVLSDKVKHLLSLFIDGKRGADLLFESERGGKLTTRTAQKVFESALRKAGVQRPATFHSLRHSFATHLLESGVDVRYIQELLGHRNIQTTQIYTKVTQPAIRSIKSPL